jgi:hypothetical protein
MDCVDCHNRPSHQYRQPENEVDEAIHAGRIDRSLPFIKREAVRIINAEWPSIEEAKTAISAGVADYYAENHPDVASAQAAAITQAGQALGDIYALNVFPKMKVWWNTYPNHIGHEQSPGCFRCHGNKLQTAERERISKDCDTCHTVLADREADPEFIRMLEEL